MVASFLHEDAATAEDSGFVFDWKFGKDVPARGGSCGIEFDDEAVEASNSAPFEKV